MFYIKEIKIRLKYFVFAFFISTSICFYNKDLLLFLLTFKIAGSNSKLQENGINYFIYTHPSELLKTYLVIVFCFSFFALVPYFLWSCLDFLTPSILKSQHQYINRRMKSGLLIVYCCNYLCFFFLFPNCWTFFESFNYTSKHPATINFHLELKIQDYLSFLKDFLYSINTCLILLIVLHVLLDFLDLKKLVWWKRSLFVGSLVLIVSTSPPDFFGQVLNVGLMIIFFEMMIVRRIIEHKIEIYIKSLQIE